MRLCTSEWPLKFRIKQCKNNRNHRIPQAFARCHHIVQLHNAMEVPSADSHTAACKSGSLQKLSSRSFPYLPHPWKRKHCVLVRSNLFYYDRDDSKGGDRGSGVINLEYYDQVVEAAAKECKKASNVFVITSQDRSFFEQGRHLFSADSHSDMLNWVGVLKKAIEQIRNNHRTTTTSSATNSTPSLNPSSKTEPKATVGPSPKPDSKIFVGPKLDALRGRTKKREEGEEDGQGGDKGKKRRGGESAEAKGDNKENVEDWYNSKERKQKYSDSSLRRRRANPSSRSMDESSLETEILKGGNPVVKKKITENASESTSTSSSLGRKQTTKTKPSQSHGAKSSPVELKFATGDLEGMMFGSLGRQLKNEKGKGSEGVIGEGASEGGGKGGKAAGGSNLERRKRKADDDGDVELRVTESGPQLESITKHRVRGPTGRRVPQNRRTQQLLMKHRASSLSALAQNDSGEVIKPSEDSAARNLAWMNRSLDLLGDDANGQQSRNSQACLTFLYSDQEDLDDHEERLFEYNLGMNEDNLAYNEDSGEVYIQGGPFVQQNSDSFNNMNLSSSSGVLPPPLPPRMESRMDYSQQPNPSLQIQNQYQLQHQQLQQQFQQQQIQLQLCSPFGAAHAEGVVTPFGTRENFSDREIKKQHRKSQPVGDIEEMLMAPGMNQELFIASYSEENSCDNSNPKIIQRQQQYQLTPAQQKQQQARLKQPSKQSQQKSRKQSTQPDMNRFTIAVRNLQRHVVELDQAVNEITKEVEDSKSDLSIVRSSLVSVRKDKDRITDALSIITQETSKMKEQLAATMKDADKLQKSATAALVVAEKAKVDQLAIKKEYEEMLKELKTRIELLKKNPPQEMECRPSPSIGKKSPRIFNEIFDDDRIIAEEEIMEEDKSAQESKKNKEKDSCHSSTSKLTDVKYDGGFAAKATGYQSFFSRPSSIISGLTNRASLSKAVSSTDVQVKDKNKDDTNSLKKDKDKCSKEKSSKSDAKSTEKKSKKEKSSSKSEKGSKSPETKTWSKYRTGEIPMMDENSEHPITSSPLGSSTDISEKETFKMGSYNIGHSLSSPSVSRPRVLNLQPRNLDSQKQGSSAASSPDSPTRPSSPFDFPKLPIGERPNSPTGFPLHRHGSVPGPLIRQSSMTTVPEDRAVDIRFGDLRPGDNVLFNRPSDPPPPPPAAIHRGVFAISRQNSTPNISLQKPAAQPVLQRQHSLGVVHEESKSLSRHSSVMSVPDDRLIVDRTLTLSPASSVVSFPGSWGSTNLIDKCNRQNSSIILEKKDSKITNGTEKTTNKVGYDVLELIHKNPALRPKGQLEQVAGVILAGSTLQQGKICPLDLKGEEPPWATSSLKRNKKVKKDPVLV